jgi:hypothetical protein
VSVILFGSPLSPTPVVPGPDPEPPPEGASIQARAGLAVAGVTHAGLTNFELTLRVSNVPQGMLKNTAFRVTHAIGRPSTCTFQCMFPINTGEQVTVASDRAKRLIFGGVVNRVTRAQQSGVQTTYDVSCLDWIWLANKNVRIYEKFVDVGVNTVVSKLLTYVDPALGLRPGRIPGDPVSLTFDGVNLEAALNELARAKTLSWRLSPHRRIDMFLGDPDPGNYIELVDDTRVKLLGFEEQLDQVRTQVQAVGAGSGVSGFHAAGSTSLAVREAGWYNVAGGSVKLPGSQPMAYSTVSAASGPGTVIVPGGIPRDVTDNEILSLYLVKNDAVAQADLATRLGGGFDGIVVYYLADGRLNLTTLDAEAQKNLDFFKNPTNHADFAMSAPDFLWNAQRRWDVGRLVPTDMESDEGDVVQGTFRISDVTLEGFADVTLSDGVTYSWQLNRILRFRPGSRFGVIDMLVQS